MPIIEPIKDVSDWTVDDWRGAFNTLTELYSKALSRAEAAEAILSAPDKVIDNMTAVISERIAAERRVAELEARLADEWQPVTEPPTTEEMYLTWDGYEIKALGYYTYWEDDSLTWRDEFDEPVADITHWRPLPPPPAATE